MKKIIITLEKEKTLNLNTFPTFDRELREFLEHKNMKGKIQYRE